MIITEKVESELQSQANFMLGVLYDGSDDWWHTIYAEGVPWDLNIWECRVTQTEAVSGLLMSAYPLTADGVTDTSKWISLQVDPRQLQIALSRIKSRKG